MATYSLSTDLLNGNIPIPTYLDKEKYVQDAADEIDSKIGHLYNTPIDISEGSPVPRWTRLLLKRINNHLATGRLLMAADAGGEDDRLHAYGWSLVQEATEALKRIAAGEIRLDGAAGPPNQSAPAISSIILLNTDPESNVEAFYDRVLNPNYVIRGGTYEAERLPR